MLYTVYEAAELLCVPYKRIYYDLRMCRFEAFKIRALWRIDIEDARRYYDDRTDIARTAQAAGGFRPRRSARAAAHLKARNRPHPCRSGTARVEGGRRMERLKKRSHRVAGETAIARQLWLWEELAG